MFVVVDLEMTELSNEINLSDSIFFGSTNCTRLVCLDSNWKPSCADCIILVEIRLVDRSGVHSGSGTFSGLWFQV
jgi:hypothetical protein